MHKEQINTLQFLKDLISIQSFSREEDTTAALIKKVFTDNGVETNQHLNNVWAVNKYYDASKPTILLNSHHDTVKPNKGYTNDPFSPIEKDGKLYGLGSNDAGGALTSLITAFVHFYKEENLKYNLVMAATAEEEISGQNGVESILDKLPKIDVAIIGEPTLMDLAVSEKGLLVVDAVAKGISGHAAREEGDNAIYKAIKDIDWIKNYKFDRVSDTLGPMKMSVTIVNAGSQHNVVPAECSYTIDIRVTDAYTHEEVMEIIDKNTLAEITPRSVRLKSSSIPMDHPLVKAGLKLGRKTYGSPTTSDQAVIPVPSLKIGPGDSARSHTADEFIYINELKEGVELYIKLLEKVIL
ncbi:M20 family metallo-hydrolase [Reichenbachiella sp. MALMAid0571]|uniref:M20 family metallo-hydrolase n=1 Tax=Reichenbachiella sp. MALMAid0571 TaxID=3143939 RepID=UPI0032DF96A0